MISAEYAAGFFDGEGCVYLTPTGKTRQMQLRVNLTNTDVLILLLFQGQFGGRVRMRPFKDHPRWKPCGQLILCGGDSEAFLKFIQADVCVKKGQVDLGLEFIQFCKEPKSERCLLVTSKALVPNPTVPGKFMTPTTWARRPETITRESEFKSRMTALNMKGSPLPDAVPANGDAK